MDKLRQEVKELRAELKALEKRVNTIDELQKLAFRLVQTLERRDSNVEGVERKTKEALQQLLEDARRLGVDIDNAGTAKGRGTR
jgi:chromosome segregation ATPase